MPASPPPTAQPAPRHVASAEGQTSARTREFEIRLRASRWVAARKMGAREGEERQPCRICAACSPKRLLGTSARCVYAVGTLRCCASRR